MKYRSSGRSAGESVLVAAGGELGNTRTGCSTAARRTAGRGRRRGVVAVLAGAAGVPAVAVARVRVVFAVVVPAVVVPAAVDFVGVDLVEVLFAGAAFAGAAVDFAGADGESAVGAAALDPDLVEDFAVADRVALAGAFGFADLVAVLVPAVDLVVFFAAVLAGADDVAEPVDAVRVVRAVRVRRRGCSGELSVLTFRIVPHKRPPRAGRRGRSGELRVTRAGAAPLPRRPPTGPPAPAGPVAGSASHPP
ncbi:hypothetical protein GCM10022243_47830 [Saccharothrix violaceirubra]